jgi:hypothetical protein
MSPALCNNPHAPSRYKLRDLDPNICASSRQSVPIRDKFLWAQLWACAHLDPAGVLKDLGSSPSEAAKPLL